MRLRRSNWPCTIQQLLGHSPPPIVHCPFWPFRSVNWRQLWPGYYATCRLIDNDVNKMNAMVTMGSKTTITAEAAAETKAQTETGSNEQSKGRQQKCVGRLEKKDPNSPAHTYANTYQHTRRENCFQVDSPSTRELQGWYFLPLDSHTQFWVRVPLTTHIAGTYKQPVKICMCRQAPVCAIT